MRTRDYHAMTNWEIESYLNRNDVIFIPVGNAECHGPFPVDCEYVGQKPGRGYSLKSLTVCF